MNSFCNFFRISGSKTVIKALLCLFLAGLTTSCINDEPSGSCEQPFILNLEFRTDFGIITYDYSRAGEPHYARYSNPSGTMTYLIRAYRLVDGNLQRDDYDEFTFSREVKGDYNYSAELALEPGAYRFYVWSDFEVDGSHYYNTDNFASITVDTDPYTGDTDLRDAYRGELEVYVLSSDNINFTQTETVQMRRPMGKYEFISTDFKEFVSKEEKKHRAQGDFNLDDYYVEFSYPQFMPSTFNMFTDKAVDSKTGIKFRSKLTPYNEDEVSLGFDYVFMSDRDGSVMVQAAIYAKEGDRLVARSSMIQVPMRRSYDTLVRGDFLKMLESEGVGIDPGFEGNFNLVAPLVPQEK